MQKPDTRQQILDLADEMIRTRGYNAFSYGDIASIMDIRRPAIHYYFPTKTDLGIAVIDQEIASLASSRSQWTELGGDQQLKRLIRTFLHSSRAGRLCLTGSLTPELTTFNPPMQEKVSEMCRGILEWMEFCLEQGRNAGSLRFEGPPGDRAILIMSCLASALLLSRALGVSVFDQSIGQLLKDLGANFGIGDLLSQSRPDDSGPMHLATPGL